MPTRAAAPLAGTLLACLATGQIGSRRPHIDRTLSGGVSVSAKLWGRRDDTFGIAGVVNGIANVHQAFFNAGGLGILIGDGQLPHPGLEQIMETHYSCALSPSMHLSFDHQFIANPGYNTDRGPVNVFSGRVHWQF